MKLRKKRFCFFGGSLIGSFNLIARFRFFSIDIDSLLPLRLFSAVLNLGKLGTKQFSDRELLDLGPLLSPVRSQSQRRASSEHLPKAHSLSRKQLFRKRHKNKVTSYTAVEWTDFWELYPESACFFAFSASQPWL